MSEAVIGRYWCYQCNQVVNPNSELEVKCPVCDGGFVEEMESRGDADSAAPAASDRSSFSLWAPVLLEMLGGPSRESRNRREVNDDDSDSDPGIESVTRRQQTSAILHVLQSVRDEHRIELESVETRRERERERRRRERLILTNPFRESILLQGSSNAENGGEDSDNSGIGGLSFGDYILGPGLELLLQHLSENDPSRYGTPPAKKEVVDALPTVKVTEEMNCSVCLDDFAIGSEAKEMPCKHKFHNECILPWLELHSSCPVCRFQLPGDESKVPNGSNDSRRVVSGGRSESSRIGEGDNSSFWVPVPWPFNGLLSSSGHDNGGNSSSSPSNSPENSHSED